MTRSSREQFDPRAEQYAASAVHRSGPSLPVLLALAAPQATDVALDVATGTGHTALALAPQVARVTGLDLSPRMLEQARRLAGEQGAANAEFTEGQAERLPFESGSFSLVTSRHAPHHFRDLDAFLREARRVLAPGGRLVIADQITPGAALVEWVDFWERTRDPSHARQRTWQEWQEAAAGAGFAWTADELVPYRLDFGWWVQQAGCGADQLAALREHARRAPAAVREGMGLEYGPEGAVLAFHEPMLVLRLDPR